ncbi:MAG: alpha/beta hydrolase [Nitrospira sp.]|nr:alpha/beta hydrolase [Nitrospira sp.]
MDSYATVTRSVVEKPFFFHNGPCRLLGLVHEPAGVPSGEAWLFCHPFIEEKLWAHRVYVSFARILAARGAWVLRFDMMGNGDSEGRFSDVSVDTMLADIDCAISCLGQLSRVEGTINLLGLRLGATLAALTAERRAKVGKLVLWDPVVDGAKYMQELLRINLTTQSAVYKEIRYNRETLVRMMREGSTVNIDGYELAYPCYEQVSAINLKEGPKRFAGRCLIVQIGKEGQPIQPDLKALQETYQAATLRTAVEEPFWKEIKRWYRTAPSLFDATLRWMDEV